MVSLLVSDSVSVPVPVSQGRCCYVEIEAKNGGLPALTEQIIGLFRLA
jgi:hypothetical protein